MNQERIQKLEALLDRIRRNRNARPSRSGTKEPIALEALPVTSGAAATPHAPPVAKQATPVAPPVAPKPAAYEAPAVPATPPGPPVSVPPVATPSWRPEPGSAVQARPTTVPPMELGEDDLIDVTTLPPGAEPDSAQAEPLVAVSAEPEEEQPPASSRRSRGPATLDDVMASASPAESEREIPVKTPPPESGPQEALPSTGLEAPRVPDVEDLEADLSGPPSMGPTAEQLGETIELDAPHGPELEIDITVSDAEPDVPAPAEELEVTLPRPSLQSGLYDVSIAAPPSLEVPEREVHVAVTVPAVASGAESPERVARPALGATDVAAVRFGTRAADKSFLELLDASLGL